MVLELRLDNPTYKPASQPRTMPNTPWLVVNISRLTLDIEITISTAMLPTRQNWVTSVAVSTSFVAMILSTTFAEIITV